MSKNAEFNLIAVPNVFAISKLEPSAMLPTWASRSVPNWVSRSPEELSIVCLAEDVPVEVECKRLLRGWRLVSKVAGNQQPEKRSEVTGVVRFLAESLASIGIRPYFLPKFDDEGGYVLFVEEYMRDQANAELEQRGIIVN